MIRYTPLFALAGGFVAGVGSIKDHLLPFFSTTKFRQFDDPDTPFDSVTQKAIDEVTEHFLRTTSLRWSDNVLGGLSPALLAQIEFYWSNQQDVSYHGSTSIHFGTFIGIPLYFKNNSLSDAETDTKKILEGLHAQQNIDPKILQTLKESLVLSEKAKEFAIFTQVNTANTLHVFQRFHFALPIAACGLGWNIVYGAVTQRSRIIQHLSVSWLFIIGAAWYYLIEKNLRLSRIRTADKKSAKVSEEVLDGGIEFVSKLIARNVALRQMDPEMEKLFTETGEKLTTGIFSFPSPSLNARLKYLHKLKGELYSEEAIQKRKELNKLKYGREEKVKKI